jgi:hypothetical protein
MGDTDDHPEEALRTLDAELAATHSSVIAAEGWQVLTMP